MMKSLSAARAPASGVTFASGAPQAHPQQARPEMQVRARTLADARAGGIAAHFFAKAS